MRWSLDRIASATAGHASGEAVVTSVAIDSRRVDPGSLFVAIRGERHDGHDFMADALAGGAAAVLCETGRLPDDAAGVEVEDTLEALRRLGVARRSELDIPVVAVTGSSGKTTTKDLIAAVLGSGTHAAPHSYNNEIGVPLTVLATPDDAAALVVEVGSRGAGHIARLAAVVTPDVAVITNIGRAHLETFRTVDAVLEAKWELVDALGPDGIAVLPSDDDRLVRRSTNPTITFGETDDADVAVRRVAVDDGGVAEFDLEHGAEIVHVRMPLPGRHQPSNAAAAVAAALALGRPFSDSAARLESAVVSPWRMETLSVACGGGAITVVNDSYNANPDSVAAALRTVVGIPGRHIAVLGKMHELGDAEGEAHREAGALAASLGFSVVAVGDDPGIAEGAGPGAESVPDVPTAVARLRDLVAPGDVILVKASRAAGLEEIVTGLQEVGA